MPSGTASPPTWKRSARYATPGLIDEITRATPSFAYRWFDDRTMTIATVHLLKTKQPDLLLVHLSETDSEQHGGGPFTPEAKAVLERSDELLGEMLKALPKDYAVGIVSDHGFEAVDHIANLKVMAAADGVTGEMTIAGGLVRTNDPKVADWLRAQIRQGRGGPPGAGGRTFIPWRVRGAGGVRTGAACDVRHGRHGPRHHSVQQQGQSRLLADAGGLSQRVPFVRPWRDARKAGDTPHGVAQGPVRRRDGLTCKESCGLPRVVK